MFVLNKIKRKLTYLKSIWLNKRPLKLTNNHPYISFSFDDFPDSAYTNGGTVLKKYGLRGTYYVSLSMLEKDSPVGKICSLNTLDNVLTDNNELGCHTYFHLDACGVRFSEYQESILNNQTNIGLLIPKFKFAGFSYPYGTVTSRSKKIIEQRFAYGRGGHQCNNKNVLDLNNLNGFFIGNFWHSDIVNIKRTIDNNNKERGWLIFCLHDITENPSIYGCSTSMFEQIVDYAKKSGAEILPVIEVLNALKFLGA
jgi:peptidoglycan/xylan/chitin deacetylase (PgdA/CDA1 family)